MRETLELWILFILSIIESQYIYGFPGRRDSISTYTMEVPGRMGYIYVRIWNGQEVTLATALNMGGTPNPNVLVRMERRGGILVVVDADPAHALHVLGENVAMANVAKHRHFIGSGLEDPVEGRRFVPGLIAASDSGGLTVQIFPCWTKYGYFAGDDAFVIDDPSTASTRAWVIVYLDTTNTPQYEVSTTHHAGITGVLDEGLIESEFTLASDVTPLGAVVVAAGGSVTESSQFADFRFHFANNTVNSFYQLLRDDGTDKTQRGKLNFVSTTSVSATVTDDAINDESEVTMAVFPEFIQDTVAALLLEGANIDLTYDDTANTLTIAVTGLTSTQISDFSEAVDDRAAGLLVAGSLIDLTYNDGANTLTIDVDLTEAASDNTPTATSEFIYLDGSTPKRGTFDAAAVASGTLIHERGGLEADVSAYSGFPKISGGATTQAQVMEQIGSVTLGSDTASVTFSSIPSTYTHLLIAMAVRTDNAATSDAVDLRFNSDSGNNYNSLRYTIAHSATLTTVESLASAQLIFQLSPGNTGIAFGSGQIWITGYAITGRPRTCHTTGYRMLNTTTTNLQFNGGGGEWTNTANAISTILLFPNGGANFISGSSFVLYGVK